MKHQDPFLLIGTDAQGESLEFGFDSFRNARHFASLMESKSLPGQPWSYWVIWGIDPITDKRRILDRK